MICKNDARRRNFYAANVKEGIIEQYSILQERMLYSVESNSPLRGFASVVHFFEAVFSGFKSIIVYELTMRL